MSRRGVWPVPCLLLGMLAVLLVLHLLDGRMCPTTGKPGTGLRSRGRLLQLNHGFEVSQVLRVTL